MTARRDSADGKLLEGGTCEFKLSSTPPYASTILWISSLCVEVLCHVDVVATKASMENSFAYRRKRVMDSASSGSLQMSVRTAMCGLDLNAGIVWNT